MANPGVHVPFYLPMQLMLRFRVLRGSPKNKLRIIEVTHSVEDDTQRGVTVKNRPDRLPKICFRPVVHHDEREVWRISKSRHRGCILKGRHLVPQVHDVLG